GDHREDVGETAGVAPLVVVPGDGLHHLAAVDRHRGRDVEDGGAGVLTEVAGDQFVGLRVQVALHASLGGAEVRLGDLAHGGRVTEVGDHVHDGDRGDGHPVREAVELALQLRDDLPDQRRGARGRRHDVHRGGAGAAQVLVRVVLQVLVVRVCVDGGHEATL